MCEIKPPLSNRPDGSYELVGLPVVSQMFPLPTGIFFITLVCKYTSYIAH